MFYTDDVSRELSSPCKNVSVPYILDLNCIKKKIQRDSLKHYDKSTALHQ